jgi:apolipoprotein N-acyltransferase
VTASRAPLAACVAVAATAAALAGYAHVAQPWAALGWVAFVPWFAVLDRTASLRGTVALALGMCAAFVLAVFWWFAIGMRAYTGAPLPVVVLVLLVAAPVVLQPQLVPFAVARRLARRRGAAPWGVAVVGAGAYVGMEWACPKLFADTLGHGLEASPWLRQAADLGGAPGLTTVLLLANDAVLATLVALRAEMSGAERLRRAAVPAAAVAALVGGLVAYGAVRERQLTRASGAAPVTAAVVQADIAHYGALAAELGTYEATKRILDAHFTLSRNALARGGVDVVVWPETVYPTTFGAPKSEEGAEFDRAIGGFVAATGVPLVFGSYDVEGGDEFNAAVFLEPSTSGRLTYDTYRKASLFPLTEHVPAVLELAAVRRRFPWLGTWKPGRGAQVLTLTLPGGRALRVAPLICYDAVDPRLALAAARQGAEVILTLSNDSWFPEGARLHLVVAAFRSIETRRPQIRATNTGISAVVDATGELRATADVDARTTLVARVTPAAGTSTLMLAWGDWVGPTGLAVAAVLLVVPPRRRRAR